MIRKEGPCLYQIGLYSLALNGRVWEARAANGNRRPFPSIAAAHLHLTGEPLDKRQFAQISRSKL